MATWAPRELRIYSDTRQAKTTLISTEELQPWCSEMTIFSSLLQQNFAPIFQIKPPHFLEKVTKFSVPTLRKIPQKKNFAEFSAKWGRTILSLFPKKVVVRFVKIWQFHVAEGTKNWPISPLGTTNLP